MPSLGSFKSEPEGEEGSGATQRGMGVDAASPVPSEACAQRGHAPGGGVRWEGRAVPGWHRTASPRLGAPRRRRGGVQHGGGAGRGRHLRTGLIPAWRSGRQCRLPSPGAPSPAHPAADSGSGCALPDADVRSARRERGGPESPRAMGNEASLEGEGLPEGLVAAAAAAGAGAGGAGSPLHTGIPAGMEADLSQLSEEERRQIAAVMSRAHGLPKGSVPPAAAESPSMHRHAQHDVYVRAYMYSFPCTYASPYVPARQYIYVASVPFILPNGVAIKRS